MGSRSPLLCPPPLGMSSTGDSQDGTLLSWVKGGRCLGSKRSDSEGRAGGCSSDTVLGLVTGDHTEGRTDATAL